MGINRRAWTYWEGPRPPYIDFCLASFTRYVPNAVILTPENIGKFIDDETYLEHAQRLRSPAQRADCYRVYVVATHGGTWVDADTVFIRDLESFYTLLGEGKKFSFCRWTDGRVLNGYFYAPENHPIVRAWLEGIRKMLYLYDVASIPWTAFGERLIGPLVFRNPGACLEYPRDVFLPVNIDRVPALFFEAIEAEAFIKYYTCAFGLNHSWFCDNVRTLVDKSIEYFMRSCCLLGDILRVSGRVGKLSLYQEALQKIVHEYSAGSTSVGDIRTLSIFCQGADLVVELGTNTGSGAALLSLFARKVVTIDVFEDLEKIASAEARKMYVRNFAHNQHTHETVSRRLSVYGNVDVIKSTTVEAAQRFAPESIDVLFIDADHTYEGAAGDFNAYFEKVRGDGFFIFHDYSPVHPGVVRFCDERRDDPRLAWVEPPVSGFYSSMVIFRKVPA